MSQSESMYGLMNCQGGSEQGVLIISRSWLRRDHKYYKYKDKNVYWSSLDCEKKVNNGTRIVRHVTLTYLKIRIIPRDGRREIKGAASVGGGNLPSESVLDK